MLEWCAHARFVWNLALEQRNFWRRGMPSLSGYDQKRQLAEARAANEWLRSGPSVVQQQAVLDLDRAFRNWWAGSHRRPTWRRKGVHEGFVIRDVVVRRLNRKWATVMVPKLGPVRFRLHRPMPETFGMGRVTLDRAGRWHVSFSSVPDPIEGPGTGEVVGVDRGVKHTIALSTGELGSCPQPDWATRRRLQRRMARQEKGSNRRARTKARLARQAAREADRRKDWIERTTTDLAKRFDVVVMERLQTKQMMRSGAGTLEAPGRNVASKRGLNRGIASQAWGLFERRLRHKIGDRLVLVPAAFTSQCCHECGHIDQANRENQGFVCTRCGHTAHADVNAAKNIAALGRRVSGRGGIGAVGPPGEASTGLIGAA